MRQKKQMFLSHPDSVFYNHGKKEHEHIPCNKAEAVEAILRSMAHDEKVIIFSLYIDVLNAYYKLCKQIGFSSVKITGEEKGNKLTNKFNQFKYSENARVLLTTLQKSAEGLNLDIATHVIILEFWWNPQKIFQAMSRIDRINQSRNIFIYLLCYHEGKETILAEENAVLENMKKKFNSAQETYGLNNLKYEKDVTKNHIGFSLFDNLLPIRFFNGNNFKVELQNYLQTFAHTPSPVKDNFMERGNRGRSFFGIRDFVVQDLQNRDMCFSILSKYPWRIVLPDIQSYIDDLFEEKLNGDAGSKLLKLCSRGSFWEVGILQDLTLYYPFIFIKDMILPESVRKKYTIYSLIFIIGKSNTGVYNVLDILIQGEDYRKEISKYLLQINHSKKKLLVISSLNIVNSLIDYIGENDIKKFDNIKFNVCLTNIFLEIETMFHNLNKELLNIEDFSLKFSRMWENKSPEPLVEAQQASGYHSKTGYALSQYEVEIVEKIFFQNSKKDAREYCVNEFIYLPKGTQVANMLKRRLNRISSFYSYPPEIRMIIGTTNIIQYVFDITMMFMETQPFINLPSFIDQVKFVSRAVLKLGDDFIPNWKQLTQKIDVK